MSENSASHNGESRIITREAPVSAEVFVAPRIELRTDAHLTAKPSADLEDHLAKMAAFAAVRTDR